MRTHPVPKIDRYNAKDIRVVPCCCLSEWTVPVRDVKEADLEIGKEQGRKVLGSWHRRNRELRDGKMTGRRV